MMTQLGRQPPGPGALRGSSVSVSAKFFCSSSILTDEINRTRSAGVRVSTSTGSAANKNSRKRRGIFNVPRSDSTSVASAFPNFARTWRRLKDSRSALIDSARSLSKFATLPLGTPDLAVCQSNVRTPYGPAQTMTSGFFTCSGYEGKRDFPLAHQICATGTALSRRADQNT